VPKGLTYAVTGDWAVAFPGSPASKAGFLATEIQKHFVRIGGKKGTLCGGIDEDELAQVPERFATVIHLIYAREMESEDYLIKSRRIGDRKVYSIAASTPKGLAYGVYHFIETAGVRFFHPHDTLIPQRAALYLPETIDVEKTPALAVRAWHAHTLHSLEYNPLLLEPTPSHFPLARELIFWLLKTRQNRLAFQVLRDVNFDSWIPYMQALVELAHDWGLQVVVEVIMWEGSSLQNSFVLVDDTAVWQAEMRQRVDFLMQVDWDGLLFWSGEFLSSNPQKQLDWIDYLTAYVSDHYPGTEVGAEIHLGDYEDTTIEYNGEEMLYYYLPKFADPRLAVYVHTVMLYNLYDPAYNTYGHSDFSSHHDFLLAELDKRRVYYYPESAYWCSFDIDVPLFLPVYAESRVRELETLLDDVEEVSGELHGVQLFSSGHEWGYWMTDYIFARAMYEGRVGLASHVAHVANGFGVAGPQVFAVLSALIEKQHDWVFEQNLIPYLSGEDIYDDIGWSLNVDTHPKRLPYAELAAMSAADREAFESEALASVHTISQSCAAFADQLDGLVDGVVGGAEDWLDELRWATRVLALRAAHSAALYSAVLAASRSQSAAAQAHLAKARLRETQALELVRQVEGLYRYSLPLYIDRYENHTIYPWGYLAQTHDLCFWRRQRLQAAHLIEHGAPIDMMALPSCID
jgi:hypothetical protein